MLRPRAQAWEGGPRERLLLTELVLCVVLQGPHLPICPSDLARCILQTSLKQRDVCRFLLVNKRAGAPHPGPVCVGFVGKGWPSGRELHALGQKCQVALCQGLWNPLASGSSPGLTGHVSPGWLSSWPGQTTQSPLNKVSYK